MDIKTDEGLMRSMDCIIDDIKCKSHVNNLDSLEVSESGE